MKIEKVIAKLEKAQDKINTELDALNEMLQDHLEEMESDEVYDDTDETEDEDFADDEDLEDDQ